MGDLTKEIIRERREAEEIAKKDWKVVYKCRNCGKLFEKEGLLVNFSIPTNAIVGVHKCGTGVYGYGDIQYSVTCDDERWENETESKDYVPFENKNEEKSK